MSDRQKHLKRRRYSETEAERKRMTETEVQTFELGYKYCTKPWLACLRPNYFVFLWLRGRKYIFREEQGKPCISNMTFGHCVRKKNINLEHIFEEIIYLPLLKYGEQGGEKLPSCQARANDQQHMTTSSTISETKVGCIQRLYDLYPCWSVQVHL